VEIRHRHVAGPAAILRTGHHQHPNQCRRTRRGRDRHIEGWQLLPCQPVRAGERGLEDVPYRVLRRNTCDQVAPHDWRRSCFVPEPGQPTRSAKS
jgi:hypothetical protein